MSSSSGIHDPYWYEATVGQEYLIKMLDLKSGIESVTFQKTASSTLDDVVVTFRDGKHHCVQVKHSRIDTNLTFSNLFLPEKSSLFSELFFDWCKENSEAGTEIILFTNRDLGESGINGLAALIDT